MFANARELTFETLALVGEPVDGGEIWFESQAAPHVDRLLPVGRSTRPVRFAAACTRGLASRSV